LFLVVPAATTSRTGGMSKETNEAGGRAIDLEKDDGAAAAADATQAKSAPPAAPSTRPATASKPAAETSSSSRAAAKEASTGGSTKGTTSSKEKTSLDKGLADEALTQVAQQKFEAQEDKLKDIARHAISSLRDFSQLSEADYSKKVIEIRKALMKYEMQYVRVWELQDRMRRAEMEESQSTSERLHREADDEGAVIAELMIQLEKEKQRKRRYEAHEATSSKVNQKRTRVELQAEIDAQTKEIEQLRQQNRGLKEQAEHLQQRAQLLREAAEDLKQLQVSQMASAVGVPPASKAGAGSHKAGSGQASIVEVIS